jgi:hypothetical protein
LFLAVKLEAVHTPKLQLGYQDQLLGDIWFKHLWFNFLYGGECKVVNLHKIAWAEVWIGHYSFHPSSEDLPQKRMFQAK